MKKNVKIAILIIACMHLSMQAMLSQLSRVRALSQTRSLQRPKANFTFSPQNNSSQITSGNKDNQLLSTKKSENFDLNKKISDNITEQQNVSGWSFYGLLSQLGIVKPRFTGQYRKENRIKWTQEELLEKLQALSNLSYGKEYLLQENYRHEVEYGDEKQAQAWLFGARYKEAMRYVQTIAEIELMDLFRN